MVIFPEVRTTGGMTAVVRNTIEYFCVRNQERAGLNMDTSCFFF